MVDITSVKEKLDILDVISSYVAVKRSGSAHTALCPFHSEKTPSFNINTNLQYYKCFGCGKGGDVINFIQEIEKVSFSEALEIACQKAGIPFVQNESTFDKELNEKKQRIISANTLTAKYYNYIFLTHRLGEKARNYIQKRGLGSKEIKDFQIGYAPDSASNLKSFLIKKGFTEKELLEFGLLVERKGILIDKFRNRIIHPIFNLKDEITGFSARYIGDNSNFPKYLNSPETIVFKKNKLLYGINLAITEAKKTNQIILVEGNFDVISVHKSGISNTVASLGTAFTEEQAIFLKKYVGKVILSMDEDKAGFNSIVKAMQILENVGLLHEVVDLSSTDFKDPDEIVQKDISKWLEIVTKPIPTMDFVIKKMRAGLDLGNIKDKLIFKEKIIPILRLLKEPLLINHYSKEVSLLLDTTREEIEKLISNPEKKLTFNQDIKNENLKEESPTISKIFGEDTTYLLASIVQNNFKQFFPLDTNIFADSKYAEILLILNEVGEALDEDTIMTLEKQQAEIYKELLIYNVGIDLKSPLLVNKIIQKLKNAFYSKEILKLRKELLVDESNSKVLEQIKKLTEKLKSN